MAEPGIVSVIIPVYNAAPYVTQAVESAVYLDAVREIILVEDGSPDNALEICQALEKKYDKVKLFRHPHGENRGAGASRNLGIQKASCEWIAFLDADDWYLPHRFDAFQEAIDRAEEFDGMYEASGFFDEEKQEVLPYRKKPRLDIDSVELYSFLISKRVGQFNTDTITLKRSLLVKAGLFNEELRLHQDVDLWIKSAFLGRLIPGESEDPVAIVRVHPQNRARMKTDFSSRSMYYASLYHWFKDKKISDTSFRILFNKHVFYHPDLMGRSGLNRMARRFLILLGATYELGVRRKRLWGYLRNKAVKTQSYS